MNTTAARSSASRANIGNFGRRSRPSHYGMATQTPRDQQSPSPADVGYFGTPRPSPYMPTQAPRNQHSASQANVGGFGGASANERGTNNGGYSTNNGGRLPTMYQPGPLDSANNGDYSPNNRGHLPTMYQPSPQVSQTNQTPPASGT